MYKRKRYARGLDRVRQRMLTEMNVIETELHCFTMTYNAMKNDFQKDTSIPAGLSLRMAGLKCTRA